MHVVVDDPDVLFRIVRIHQDLVRSAAHFSEAGAPRRRRVFVVLEPLHDRVAGAVHGEDQMVPPHLIRIRVSRVVAPAGVGPARIEKARANPRLGAGRQRDLSTLHHPDFVWTLRPHTGTRPPRPAVVRKVRVGQRLRPGHYRLVVAHINFADRSLGLALAGRGNVAATDESTDGERNGDDKRSGAHGVTPAFGG